MADLIDVAEYILEQTGSMPSTKLQKLVYYCQGWHLAWDGEPLFEEEIHAWANGPVVPALYELHRGQWIVHPGMLRHAAAAQAARVGVRFCAHARSWVWSAPDLIEGGPDLTGAAPTAAECADEARRCLEEQYRLGNQLLALRARRPEESRLR